MISHKFTKPIYIVPYIYSFNSQNRNSPMSHMVSISNNLNLLNSCPYSLNMTKTCAINCYIFHIYSIYFISNICTSQIKCSPWGHARNKSISFTNHYSIFINHTHRMDNKINCYKQTNYYNYIFLFLFTNYLPNLHHPSH